VRPLSDSRVAYVCGRLSLLRADGTNREGTYWRFEVALRGWESKMRSVTGGSGSIYAVRRDTYATLPPERAAKSPYVGTDHLQYRPELTAASFGTIRRAVRVMCIDTHEELKEAWAEIIKAGMPADALAVMGDVSALPYRADGEGDPGLESRDALVSARRMTELGAIFRENYRRAAELARQHQEKR
jgi:hypothetical protein